METSRTGLWASIFATCAAAMVSARAFGGTAYSQPPDPAGGQYKSAWYAPDGLDDDQYVWDSFTLASNTAITEVHWRGAYTNYLSGAGKAPVYDFTVAIYSSTAGNTEPFVAGPPLVSYHTNGNAGETPAGTFGGVQMYDYAFVLPSAFQAVGGTKYWIQIEAYQGLTPTYSWPPDWSIAKGTGGNGSHFRKVGGTGGMYTFISGDCAFTLLTSSAPTYTINADVFPVGAGSIQGAGVYPAGSSATLVASPSAGFGFLNWTESGAQVSSNASYTFSVTRDRTLVANFTPAYTITTGSFPLYGGTTSGAGVFNSGSQVTVAATPRLGYVFESWTEWGTVVSTSSVYTFAADADHPLVANFVPGPLTIPFDLDSGFPLPQPTMTGTPSDNNVGGVNAHFSSPQGMAFSYQSDQTTWYHQVHLFGTYLWPNSIYRNDLVVQFSEPITAVSLDFATIEMEAWADTPSPLKLTAYNDSMANPPVGTAQSAGTYGGTTYPEGVLVFQSATPFNLIHLTVGPNQWGTNNFMADNFSVVLSCSPTGVAAQPVSATVCPTGSAVFAVAASGLGTPGFQWQRESSPGVFVDLADGVWDSGTPGISAVVWGSTTETLSIAADIGARLDGSFAVNFRCVLSNPCSTVTSDAAHLTVCVADFNCDQFSDAIDYDLFISAWLAGDPSSDINADGFSDAIDYDVFIAAWLTGC